ncbi:ferritin-like domain-containing protein [Gaiella sp.]|uniref:ferritin-like domain-containing protein n=1 Tax=Gaiella sp. TaxID=2663207 RepID=UPI0032645150
MSDHLTLEVIDADGAEMEAYDNLPRSTRMSLLQRGLVAGGTIAVGGVVIGGLPKLVTAAPSPSQDVDILNFALTLEYLEAEFYIQAVAGGALSGELLKFAKVVKAHEVAHVAFLKGALGAKAIAKPTFDFKGTTDDPAKFQATSIVLEDTGVAAYNGQGTRVTRKLLAAAASVVSVEARHAAWIRDIARKNPAPVAFDPAKSQAQILSAVTATGFTTG